MFLPLYKSRRQWKDRSRVELELPLFPCYLFVCIDRRQKVRVLEVPGVLGVVSGTGGEMAQIPEDTVLLLRAVSGSFEVEPVAKLCDGDKVRILAGAFSGMEGQLVVQNSRYRVLMTVEQIMRSFAVEVSPDDLESVVG